MFADIKSILALITLVFFFCCIVLLFFTSVPKDNLDLLKTFGLSLISALSFVIGYYFGSSDGSARKTELLTPPLTPGAPLTGLSTLEPKINPPPADAGFIRIPFLSALLALSLLILLGLSACGTPGTVPVNANPIAGDTPVILAGKSLLAVKSTIVVAATSVDVACKNKIMSTQDCLQAKNAYKTAQAAYDAAVDAYLLYQAGSGNQEQFDRALANVSGLATSLLMLSGDLK